MKMLLISLASTRQLLSTSQHFTASTDSFEHFNHLTDQIHVSTTSLTSLNYEYESKNLAKNLWIYLGPCIFTIGIIGNLLIILVMGHSNMKGTSTCTYLKWMAVADIFTLVTGMIPEWLEHRDILVFKEIHEATCKLEKFTNFLSVDTSIWICVVFTVDRFIAVCFPMSEAFLRPSSNAKFFAIVAFFVAIIKNIHILWTRGAEYKIVTLNPDSLAQNNSFHETSREPSEISYQLVSNCGSPTAAFQHFEKFIRPWIAFVSISLIPCLVIIVCNIFIIRSLLLLKFNRNKIPSDSENGNVLQMTALCLTASICFMVCNTPSMILLIGKPYWNSKNNKTYELTKLIINQIFYVNHSINFFLYCITGKRFRQSLTLLCQSYKRHNFTYEVSRQELLEKVSLKFGSKHQQLVDNSSTKTSLRAFLSKNYSNINKTINTLAIPTNTITDLKKKRKSSPVMAEKTADAQMCSFDVNNFVNTNGTKFDNGNNDVCNSRL